MMYDAAQAISPLQLVLVFYYSDTSPQDAFSIFSTDNINVNCDFRPGLNMPKKYMYHIVQSNIWTTIGWKQIHNVYI